VLLVTDREALAVVAERVGDFGMLVAAHDRPRASNAELWELPTYRSIMAPIASDIGAIAARDRAAGVGIRGHAHRLFDVGFLRAPTARFELVAVVDRMDRRALDQTGCGELRLLYRLGYAESRDALALALRSRLPMTLAVELQIPGERSPARSPADCREAAQRWLPSKQLSGRALGAWLVASSGPLAPERVTRARMVQLGINVQTVRWPSAVRPDLGGHAEYALRAFTWDEASSRYRARKLENTPDVARIAASPALRASLAAWIADPARLLAIDGGHVLLPDAWLAESAVSVTPRGLARRSNRPFRQLFSPADFASLPLASLRFAGSPEALLRRLDDLTCSGCHESRSIAGFHQLGDDGLDALAGNALATGTSPHVVGDLPRRRAYVLALARGEQPDEARPLSERALAGDDGYGSHCGLGDPGFASWGCAKGLHCDPYEAAVGEDTVGVCLPSTAGAGDPCEPARVVADADGRRDRVQRGPVRACSDLRSRASTVCERTAVGFPGGMCAGSCDSLAAGAACGSIAILSPFNGCLAAGRPFSECASQHVRPAALRACSLDAPCRDDYLCARGPNGGVCLPPYFVFQMRVDGHPSALSMR
jgi:hypothetical protein